MHGEVEVLELEDEEAPPPPPAPLSASGRRSSANNITSLAPSTPGPSLSNSGRRGSYESSTGGERRSSASTRSDLGSLSTERRKSERSLDVTVTPPPALATEAAPDAASPQYPRLAAVWGLAGRAVGGVKARITGEVQNGRSRARGLENQGQPNNAPSVLSNRWHMHRSDLK
jgi:hypothetical protein